MEVVSEGRGSEDLGHAVAGSLLIPVIADCHDVTQSLALGTTLVLEDLDAGNARLPEAPRLDEPLIVKNECVAAVDESSRSMSGERIVKGGADDELLVRVGSLLENSIRLGYGVSQMGAR
jgi:hypothetical protein